MRGRVGSVVTVVLLSVLVWLIAESQTLRTERVRVEVRLEGDAGDGASAGSGLVRVLDDDWGQSAELVLRGGAGSVSAIIDELEQGLALVVGRDLDAEPGVRAIDLRSVLGDLPEFRESGVSVAESRPASVRVEIDRVVRRSAAIEVVWPADAGEGSGRAQPGEVMLVGPAQVLDDPAREGDVTVRAALGEAELRGLAPGVATTLLGVRLQVDGLDADAWGVSIQPRVADITVERRVQTAEHTIDRLPVQLMLPPAEMGRWTIEIAPDTRDLLGVLVRGPRAEIERVRGGEVRPRAFVSLTFEDLEAGVKTATATVIGLPPGLSVSIPDPVVSLTIRRSDASEPGPQP